MEDYLKSIYYDTTLPSAFTSVDKLYKHVKKEGTHAISKGRIRKFLRKQRVYTAHKQVRKRFKRPRVVVPKKHYQWAADTMNMMRYHKDNDGFGYILIMIDILSRYVYAVPLKTLQGKEMVTALKTVFEGGTKPSKIQSDKGVEFNNRLVKGFLSKEGVDYFTTSNPETKANFSERVIQTIKARLTRYMDYKQKHRWVDVLQDVIEGYNNTYHRSIKMSPSKALKTPDPDLWDLQYKTKPKKP
jgi:hypothetical protein